VLAGAPGGGKSTVAANWAWRSQDPILYLAIDRPLDMMQRLVAIGLDKRMSEVAQGELDYWSTRLTGKRDELVIETGTQTVESLEHRLIALTEWLMEPPHVVFVDNLFDLRSEGNSYMSNDFYADVLPALKQLAINHDVGIVLLHHVTRSGERGKKHGQGSEPLTMTDLLHGGEREAAHVWGVYRGHGNRQLFVQVLKQGHGRADAGGSLKVALDWSPETMRTFSR